MEQNQTDTIEQEEIDNENTDIVIKKTEQDKPALQYLGDALGKKIENTAREVSELKVAWKKNKKKILSIDINDKKGQELLKEQRAILRNARTKITKDLPNDVKPLTEAIAYYRGGMGAIVQEIEIMEAPYDLKHEELKKNKIEEDQRLEREKAERIRNRVDLLNKAGAYFDNSYYSIGSVPFDVPETSLGIVDIEVMSDQLFSEQLEVIKSKKLLIDQKQEEKERQDKILEDNRLEKERLEKEQFQKDQEKLLEDMRILDEQKKEQEEEMEELRNQRIEMRSGALLNIGFNWSKERGHLYYDSHVVLVNDIATCSKSDWNVLLIEMQVAVTKLKEAAEILAQKKKEKDALIAARLNDISQLGMRLNEKDIYESYGIGIPAKTLEVIHTEQWDEMIIKIKNLIDDEKKSAEKIIADKAIEAAKVTFLKNQKRKLDELAAADDKTKWESFVEYLKNYPVVEMESDEYKKLLSSSVDAIGKIIKTIV